MTNLDLKKRPAKDPARARAEILQAALEEFAERGFDAATVRDIAARTGMTHGMIRYHYETKEKLWFAAVAYLFDRQNRFLAFSPEEQQALPYGSRERAELFLRRYVRYCAQHPEHARILMQETVSLTRRMETALTAHLKPVHELFSKELLGLQSAGLLNSSAPVVSLMYMITGACQNLFALAPEAKVTMGYDALTEEAIEAHADLIVETFLPAQ